MLQNLESSHREIGYGVTRIEISPKDLVFEESSTRPLKQKRFDDFSSKTLEVRTIVSFFSHFLASGQSALVKSSVHVNVTYKK